MPENDGGSGVSRRKFLKGAGLVGAGTVLLPDLFPGHESAAQPAPLTEAPRGTTLRRGTVRITLNVNGRPVTMSVEPRTTLLNALRNNADPPITGPKLVCDQGACGACTVLVDGHTAYACQLLAVDVVGRKITTVEGLSDGETLNSVQKAFVEKDALMCGFCTPGFIVSLSALQRDIPSPTEEQIRQACAGNTCRCGTYPRIYEAALQAAKANGGA